MNSIGWRCTRLVLIDSTELIERDGERDFPRGINVKLLREICAKRKYLGFSRIFKNVFLKVSIVGLFYSILFKWTHQSLSIIWSVNKNSIFSFIHIIIIIIVRSSMITLFRVSRIETQSETRTFPQKTNISKETMSITFFSEVLPSFQYFNVCIQHTFPRENSFDKVGRCTRGQK